MQVPPEYQGREQSFLKHRVLHEYLLGWGLKLGSLARGRRVRLCYADGFAGPWKAKSAALEDTSIAIGLDALEDAVKTWSEQGALFDVEAAFVEKDDTAFGELEKYLKGRSGAVRTFARHGEFGAFVPYRAKLKELCRIPHAADLAIPHPTMDRTKFRLVVGGKGPAVAALFRDIEKKVIGQEAAAVRETASVRESEQRTGQLTLL